MDEPKNTEKSVWTPFHRGTDATAVPKHVTGESLGQTHKGYRKIPRNKICEPKTMEETHTSEDLWTMEEDLWTINHPIGEDRERKEWKGWGGIQSSRRADEGAGDRARGEEATGHWQSKGKGLEESIEEIKRRRQVTSARTKRRRKSWGMRTKRRLRRLLREGDCGLELGGF